MNANAIFKALSNEHRLQILLWLKTPKQHFAAERLSTAEETGVAGGVCVNAIVEKTGLTQSVVSTYLNRVERRRLGAYRACRKMDVLLLPA